MRLTVEKDGRWSLRGVAWDKIWDNETLKGGAAERLFVALSKLKEYEDTGLNPCEVEQLKDIARTERNA